MTTLQELSISFVAWPAKDALYFNDTYIQLVYYEQTIPRVDGMGVERRDKVE